MSRRTKFIIAAIFLVLLAIPVLYVALNWRTPNPLRFHIVAYHPPGSPEAWPEYGKLDLRVENTSHLPIQLFRPGFGRADFSLGSTQLRAVVPPSSGPGTSTVFNALQHIPPHSSASFPCRVIIGNETSPVTWEHEELSYTWMSDTMHKYVEICMWLTDRTPERFREFTLPPNYFVDTTELIPAKP